MTSAGCRQPRDPSEVPGRPRDPGVRRDDGAFAGMTGAFAGMTGALARMTGAFIGTAKAG